MKSDGSARRSDPAASFLLNLEDAGPQPLVARARGTIMLELTSRGADDHWLVTLDDGRVEVVNRPGPADVVVRMRRELFASAALGRSNLWTAILRNDVSVEGDLHLLVVFQRLLPGPPNGTEPPGYSGGAE